MDLAFLPGLLDPEEKMAIAKANASMGRGTVPSQVIRTGQNQADDNGTWCQNCPS
jgi:hypothetical protein